MVHFTDNVLIWKNLEYFRVQGKVPELKQARSHGESEGTNSACDFSIRRAFCPCGLPLFQLRCRFNSGAGSTQVPVQLRNFALWRTGRKILPAIGGPANTAAPSRKSKSPNAEDNFSNPTMSVRTTDCNAMMNPGKKRLRFSTEIHSKKRKLIKLKEELRSKNKIKKK